MASSAYLLNDVIDREQDKQHPFKSERPIASGQLTVLHALVSAGLFALAAFSLSFYLPPLFRGILWIYFILTLLYSVWLKQQLLVDVIVLSILYTLRIMAGMSLLVMRPYSHWMLLFSVFLFLSLAFLKRVSELSMAEQQGLTQIQRKGYASADRLIFAIFGIASGFSAILIFAFYLYSKAALSLYVQPQWLLSLLPLMLYWLCRIWLLAAQGKIVDDPVLFTLKDKVSYIVGLFVVFLLLTTKIQII